MSAEMDRLLAEFEKFQSKIEQAQTQFSTVGEMQSELTTLEAQAVSPDRSVTVVAGPGGSVRDIQLTADAMRQQPQQLAATILATLHRAVADAAQQQAGIVDAHMGAAFNLNLKDQVFEAQAEALGTTAADLKSKISEESPPSAKPTRDDGDFSEETVLRRADEPATGGTQAPSTSSAGDQFLKNLFDNEEDHR
ncbi:YbaB/EbfC family nucleoid-associated protein [Amycolatopsis suaedae]|uniref:YbaB/EbfC family DNA-binding protein n=1 Tax=Amycolatopsis suaedae TaxID=2510978 RepID=A0A4Q7JCA0_9PSEU|nr:YbaB/EbfC family nucleoid-associated protein [Amycolatopsis suaedae]RZQ64163.1 YbaB/EbfC family DNA-binding protein [Amycolatopsis suaedae]